MMTDFEKYIQRYLDLIPSENWLEEMERSTSQTIDLYRNISEKQSGFAYAEGKWSLKILLQHIIDAERIFIYRALRFSRKDLTELSGWNEEEYSENYFLEGVSLESILEEFEYLAKSNTLFFKNLNSEMLVRSGMANQNELSVETIGKLMVGHRIHHLNIIKERYLPHLK